MSMHSREQTDLDPVSSSKTYKGMPIRIGLGRNLNRVRDSQQE